ncbi:SphA family protein [Azorhizobium oxalatiphilum]|nr:transporter [Azorhizobium oxalatiphilum]
MAGYLPPPGVYLQNDVYFYEGSGGSGRIFSSGGRLIADVSSKAQADFLTGTWVLPADVLGGHLAVGAILPAGHVSVNAGAALYAPRFDAVFARGVQDDAWIVGDPVLSAVLGWHAGNFHWNVTGLLNVPVGNYRNDALANLAFHRWAGDVSLALTWFDPKIGWDLSGAVGLTFNGTNEATDYTTGTEFHAEWALTKTLSKEWSAGLIGYYYQQITGDSGSGAQLGAYEGRVAALGGTIAYNFEVGKTPVSARLKVYREFAAENRLEGTLGFLTVAFPLSIDSK